MGSRLLYRDGLMLIIDKPAGLAVHKGPKSAHGHGPSLEDYFDSLRFGLPRMPSLAHRLDKETSGCLVLGRHRKALADLSLLFRHGKVGKTYWALVEGGPEADEGRIDLPLGRLDDKIGWWMKHDPEGLPSSTTWKVMGRSGRLHLARARTADRADASVARALRRDGLADPGRQHLWQRRRARADRGLHLHAREIVVPLYKNRPPIKVTAPVPPHMHGAAESVRVGRRRNRATPASPSHQRANQ